MSMQNTLLVVDDDAEIREELAYLLHNEGYVVVTAANGLLARDLLQQAQALPDVILLDLMMPVMDGWRFRTEQLADARLARIPVIVLSGAGDVRREAAALGADGYLAKPFKLNALLDIVRRACPAPVA